MRVTESQRHLLENIGRRDGVLPAGAVVPVSTQVVQGAIRKGLVVRVPTGQPFASTLHLTAVGLAALKSE